MKVSEVRQKADISYLSLSLQFYSKLIDSGAVAEDAIKAFAQKGLERPGNPGG